MKKWFERDMNNLTISFNAIMPMFLVMGLGYFLREKRFLTPELLTKLNRVNFNFFLSVLCFQSAYSGDLSGISSGSVILFCVVGVLLEYFVGYYLSRRIDPKPDRHAILMQCFFRTNTMLIGLPLAKALFSDITLIVIVYAVTVPLYNFLAAMAFEKDRGGKLSFTGLILKNPLVISTLLGILFNILRIPLPTFVNSAIGSVSSMASGLSLIILGSNFTFTGISRDRKTLLIACAVRLILLPAVFFIPARLLGYHGAEMYAVLSSFGGPVPPSMFTMAKEMGGDAEFASEVVVFSTLFSLFTLFIWVFVLKSLQMM